jgi:ribonucleoside-diphosphate reductase alpha chain/ribonucleoside-triphosphate reductase
MPYEAITKKEYEKRVKEMLSFIPSLISKYEKEEIEIDVGDESCSSGACPIR